MRKAFALQKLLTFFQHKILAYLRYWRLKFNVLLTNDVVSFEQPGPGVLILNNPLKLTFMSGSLGSLGNLAAMFVQNVCKSSVVYFENNGKTIEQDKNKT